MPLHWQQQVSAVTKANPGGWVAEATRKDQHGPARWVPDRNLIHHRKVVEGNFELRASSYENTNKATHLRRLDPASEKLSRVSVEV
ncbi:hypothetical protein VTI28DRAFT_6908 [Corynascus sepedonium]